MVIGRATAADADEERRKHFAELQLNVTGKRVKHCSTLRFVIPNFCIYDYKQL
jgi:hypothetical protein